MSKSKLSLFVIALSLLSFGSRAQQTPKHKFQKLQWLVGKWNRTNAEPGNVDYETWTKISDVKLVGKGIASKAGKVTFMENLEFLSKGNDIYYTVRLSEDKVPVYFKLTQLTDSGFTCENPKHDFPKKITYSYKGNKAKAVISGGGQSIDYNFVREVKK